MSNKKTDKNAKDRSVKDSTMAALMRDKPRRGRPKHAVSRQSVYVALCPQDKKQMSRLGKSLPGDMSRADVPDLAVTLLTIRLESVRRAVSGRNREIPEGITDLESFRLLWDLPLSDEGCEPSWTSVRLSPQQGIELGRAHGTLNALFGSTRSDVFALALSLLVQFIDTQPINPACETMEEMRNWLISNYL
ncbi:MAG TPA: hypothetical protein VLL52_07225 [Anaerolineae bacterium]|nr:hypothetical protein [Anaerolineae bacterium]